MTHQWQWRWEVSVIRQLVPLLAWSVSVDVGTLPDGEVMVTADHSAGGVDSPQAVAYVMKDTLLPTVSIDQPAKLSDAALLTCLGGGL